MIISESKKIIDIQRELYQLFPYLKIEFYKGYHEEGKGPSNRTMLSPNETIEEARTIHQPLNIKITGQLSVLQLESMFQNRYGICIQVWRRSGKHWFQTYTTDHWTLDEQNEEGKNTMIHPEKNPFLNS